MNPFNVYLILAADNWNFSRFAIPYIKKNIPADKVFIVSSKKILNEDLLGCQFIDENEILRDVCGLSFNSVYEYIDSLKGLTKNTGWFLQQFIKLGLSRICTDEYYLVWDADTIPLNPISFFDKNGKPYINLKREYFYSYFRTIQNLFGLEKNTKESFISEHMFFNAAVVREMLDKIEHNEKLAGTFFWQKIFSASDLHTPDPVKQDNQRYFSEFETYGTYCDAFHPDLYSKRKLRTLRCGTDILGKNPSAEILDWAAKDFDTISFEEWGVPIPEIIEQVNDSAHREKLSFADTIRQFLKPKLRKDFEGFNDFFARTYFDFFFNKKAVYRKKLKIERFLENSFIYYALYIIKEKIVMMYRFIFYKF